MKCDNCGSENVEGTKFCVSCGAPMPGAQPVQQAQSIPPVQPVPPVQSQVQNEIPKELKPISAWGYWGLKILFAIPVIGFIFLLVFSLGGTQNRNLKSFARSYFCDLLIAVILTVVLAIVIFATGFNLAIIDYLNSVM